MNVINDPVRALYWKYLTASFGSALITSVYGLVDMAVVGQYHGPDGAAAMAVIAPIWNGIYSCGLLTGIGGAILFSGLRGRDPKSKESNQYFTTSLVYTLVLATLLWVGLIVWEEPLLSLFGADLTLLPLAKAYLIPVKCSVPVFLFTQMLSAFLRNDGNPALATRAVVAGGVFNLVGDFVLVFAFDLGILGAGIATVGGASISLLVMLSHFFSKKNTLRLCLPKAFLNQVGQITLSGFSTFFIDIAMGILTMLFNRQIMTYLGTNALAVYGIIVNVSTLVQCCAYGIGQAAQPILSANFGAKKWDRIATLLGYTLISVAILGTICLGTSLCFPTAFVRIFMTPTPQVLAIAPAILSCYGLSFLLLPFNIYATYHFQSIMRPGLSFVISVGRGLVLSGGLILFLPWFFGENTLWLAMPITELLVAIFAAISMKRTLLRD